MSPKKKDAEDQRAEDQDAAIEAAFAAGTLPEDDRRTPEEKEEDERTARAVAVLGIIESAGRGSTFRREKDVWRVHLVDDAGTAIDVSGPTIAEAVASHGQRVEHAVTVAVTEAVPV